MRRPSPIAIVLLATGIPPVAFTIALFVLGSIPDNIAPPLTIAFVLIPMVVFLPLFAFVGFKDVARRTRREIVRTKTLVFHCPICDAGIPHTGLRELRRARREHIETLHPEFFHYAKRINKLAVLYWAGLIFLAITATFWFFVKSYVLSLAGFLAVLPLLYFLNWFFQKQVREFRRRWIEHTSAQPLKNTP